MQIATGRANGTTFDQTSFDLNSGLPESEHISESFLRRGSQVRQITQATTLPFHQYT